jgi:hypothetical protein
MGRAEVVLQSAGSICLSFEHYKMQDGWTPIAYTSDSGGYRVFIIGNKSKVQN